MALKLAFIPALSSIRCHALRQEPMAKRRERKKVAALPKQKKKRKAPALRKVTNEHMPELFAGEAPTQID